MSVLDFQSAELRHERRRQAKATGNYRMKCQVCDKEFDPKKPWQVNCSSKCRSRKANSNRRDETREYNAEHKFTPVSRYNAQKQTAKRRGIAFDLTFEEWWDIWEPFWHMRGRDKDSLVMCRVNDQGSYSKTNVYIDTVSANSSLAATLKPKQRGSDGRFISGIN